MDGNGTVLGTVPSPQERPGQELAQPTRLVGELGGHRLGPGKGHTGTSGSWDLDSIGLCFHEAAKGIDQWFMPPQWLHPRVKVSDMGVRGRTQVLEV